MKSGRVGPKGQKMGPIGSDWPQIGLKCNDLIKQNEPRLNLILGRVGPQSPNSG